MSKDLSISKLADAYGALLTEHALSVLREYYDDDLSLGEIAEQCGVTRQAVLKSLQSSCLQLKEYEKKMGLVKKSEKIGDMLQTLSAEIDGDVAAAKDTVNKIIDLI